MTIVMPEHTLILSLHYLVKCRSGSLDIDNNKLISGSAVFKTPFIWKCLQRKVNHTIYHLELMRTPAPDR